MKKLNYYHICDGDLNLILSLLYKHMRVKSDDSKHAAEVWVDLDLQQQSFKNENRKTPRNKNNKKTVRNNQKRRKS